MYPTPSFVTVCTGTASIIYGAVHAEKSKVYSKEEKHRSQNHRNTTNMHICIKITVILQEVTGTFLSLCIPIISQKTQASTAEVWAVQRGSAA